MIPNTKPFPFTRLPPLTVVAFCTVGVGVVVIGVLAGWMDVEGQVAGGILTTRSIPEVGNVHVLNITCGA